MSEVVVGMLALSALLIGAIVLFLVIATIMGSAIIGAIVSIILLFDTKKVP